MGKLLLKQSTEILIDQIPLGILTFSFHGRVEFINQNFHKLGMIYQFNTSLLNINIFKYNLFPPINIIEDLKAVVKGRPFEKEIKHVKTNDGRFISLLAKGSPIYEDENISGGMLIIEDLQFLSDTGDDPRLKLTDQHINKEEIFLIVTDTSGAIKYSAGKEIRGFNLLRKEITGRNIHDIFNPPLKQKVADAFSTAVQFGKLQFLQIEFESENNNRKFDCTVEPVISENGFVQIVYLVFKESPLPQEEIQSMVVKLQGLEYYKEISRRRDTGLILISRNGSIVDWDEQFESISGINKTGDQLSILEFFPSLSSDEIINLISQLDDENSCDLTTYLESKTSGKLPVHLTFYKSKEVKSDFIVVCRRIKLDSALLHSGKTTTETKEEIREIKQPMCKIDTKGSIISTNKAFLSLLEFKEVELFMSHFFDFIIPDDIDRIKNEIQNLEYRWKKITARKIAHHKLQHRRSCTHNRG